MKQYFSNIRRHFSVYTYLEEFEEYCEIIESQFDNKIRKFKEMENKVPKEHLDAFWDFYVDEYHDIFVAFPNIHRSSLCISLHTFLEHQLDSISAELQRNYDLKISPEDLKDKGITRSKTYLKKVVGINFPDSAPHWNFITNCNLIRNQFAHNRGILDKSKDNKKIINAISQLGHSYIENDEFIRLEKEFCPKFIEEIKLFLDMLFDEIDIYIKENKSQENPAK
ncbi:hypothetical protein ABFV99_00540 [Cytobacillus horneckiae]|uniref:hypothetical protein n=1 Tax=Cytobacillus horneckiae TaxID=549687 RepID=UPI0034CDCA46